MATGSVSTEQSKSLPEVRLVGGSGDWMVECISKVR